MTKILLTGKQNPVYQAIEQICSENKYVSTYIGQTPQVLEKIQTSPPNVLIINSEGSDHYWQELMIQISEKLLMNRCYIILITNDSTLTSSDLPSTLGVEKVLEAKDCLRSLIKMIEARREVSV